MRGPHDIGGIEDFGRVPRDHDEHLAWHESVMRMLFALALLGLARTSGEVRSFVEAMSPEEYRARGYYERWLVAVEALLDRARHSDDAALAESASGPSAAALGFGDQSQPQPGVSQPKPHHFDVGSSVTVRNNPPPGHNRLPMYVRGRAGIVRAMYPPQVVPHAPSDDLREPVYSVAFLASDLWPDAQDNDEVLIDLFASYLDQVRGIE